MAPPKGSVAGPMKMRSPGKIEEEVLDKSMIEAREKLKEKFGSSDANRLGGKGTARRKKVGVHRSTMTDEKRLQMTLKKMSLAPIPGIEEVMMFKDDNTVLEFSSPKVQAAPASNTYVITGTPETKGIEQVLSRMMNNSIMPKFSPEMIQQLRAAADQSSSGKTPSFPTISEEPEGDGPSQGTGTATSSSAAAPAGPSATPDVAKSAAKGAAESSDSDDDDDDDDSDDAPDNFEVLEA